MTPLPEMSAMSTIWRTWADPAEPANALKALLLKIAVLPSKFGIPLASKDGSHKTSLSSSAPINPSRSKSRASKTRSISSKSSGPSCTAVISSVALMKFGASLNSFNPPTLWRFCALVSAVLSSSCCSTQGWCNAAAAVILLVASLIINCRIRSRLSRDRFPHPARGGNLTLLRQMALRQLSTSRPSKGTKPHRNWYMDAPTPHMSAGSPKGSWEMTSGAM
mmetsp:Transcript_56946/g.152060  ORF Transcript_56946/g.152060 Transcript_56946/m.152060 type:complete len:221 (-) Transcript_56946:782-1444(-)